MQVETLLWQVEQDAVGDYVQESVKISQLDQRIKVRTARGHMLSTWASGAERGAGSRATLCTT